MHLFMISLVEEKSTDVVCIDTKYALYRHGLFNVTDVIVGHEQLRSIQN